LLRKDENSMLSFFFSQQGLYMAAQALPRPESATSILRWRVSQMQEADKQEPFKVGSHIPDVGVIKLEDYNNRPELVSASKLFYDNIYGVVVCFETCFGRSATIKKDQGELCKFWQHESWIRLFFVCQEHPESLLKNVERLEDRLPAHRLSGTRNRVVSDSQSNFAYATRFLSDKEDPYRPAVDPGCLVLYKGKVIGILKDPIKNGIDVYEEASRLITTARNAEKVAAPAIAAAK
jgi:hypothetical protein